MDIGPDGPKVLAHVIKNSDVLQLLEYIFFLFLYFFIDFFPNISNHKNFHKVSQDVS